MPVGGSRHYPGGGLGQEGLWRCPSCGEDNDGPIAQGCSSCGAGKPGRHIGREAAPPPPPPAAPEPEERPTDVASYWAAENPNATIEAAYRAGYLDGARAMRRAQQQAPPPAAQILGPEGKIARTIVAALSYFADQVLRQAPPEVASGEWCSVDEVLTLMQQLTTTGEVTHA